VNAYIGAFFKANYPLIFYKVACDYEDKQILSHLFQDMKIHGIKLRGFDVNKSEYKFSINKENNELVVGFNMIKGVSKKIVDDLINERNINGTFENIIDFFVALDNMKTINKRTIEPLIFLGTFDTIYPNRAELLKLFDLFQEYKKKKKLKTESKRWKLTDIFKKIKEYNIQDFSNVEKNDFEFKYLDLYLNNPLDEARTYYLKNDIKTIKINEYQSSNDNVLGIINNCEIKKTKKKDPYLDITFTDMIDTINIKVWSNKMTDGLQKKGNICIMRLEYNEMFKSYNLINSHVFNT
jgi:DNA polymerase-3 subunit alpha